MIPTSQTNILSGFMVFSLLSTDQRSSLYIMWLEKKPLDGINKKQYICFLSLSKEKEVVAASVLSSKQFRPHTAYTHTYDVTSHIPSNFKRSVNEYIDLRHKNSIHLLLHTLVSVLWFLRNYYNSNKCISNLPTLITWQPSKFNALHKGYAKDTSMKISTFSCCKMTLYSCANFAYFTR